ncbi:hypothetical protein [Streptomyces sp. NPDC048172]|uniref:hypothetical protein n=1 Tax=Streptomyces sp. NPDC048172 TaxID=3365505 RepID=UPI003710DFA3
MPLRHRIRALKRPQRILLAVSAALVVLVLAGVSLVVPWGEDATACRTAPGSARTLAQDPARAAAALDPGKEATRTAPLEKLLRTEGAPLCENEKGTRVAGRALVAAATGRTVEEQDERARPHKARSARIVHAAVRVLGENAEDGEARFPAALAPYVARALAAYIADVQRDLSFGGPRDWAHPAASTEDARYEDGSGNWASPFPRPGEYHAVFGRVGGSPEPDLKAVIHRLTLSPQAYAILYDAERAHLAGYLERLGDDADEPAEKPRTAAERREAEKRRKIREKKGIKEYREDPLTGTELELGDFARLTAILARGRTDQVENGAVPDLAAYDRAVLRHTKGLYRASGHRVSGTPPPQGTYAQRRPDAPAGKGNRAAERLMDGRVQLFAAFDAWARERDIPRGTADRLRTEADTRYGLTLRYP